MEFLLISLLLIYFATVAMCLLSHGPHVILSHVTHCDCDVTICDIVIKSRDTFPCSTL